MVEQTKMTDDFWKKKLTDQQYNVTRRKGTEPPFTGEYTDTEDEGVYKCVCCGEPLFSSDAKFHSGSGWPSFYQPIAKENIIESVDMSLGMTRTAVTCRLCEAHLGHVFDDGPKPTGLRYCMNSVSMRFAKAGA